MLIKDKIYGEFEINDELVKDILKTKAMQRLKALNQYCLPIEFLNPKFNTTRFEHSVGVYLLLKKLGASREEQIAGLIHDISHTALSHLIDFVHRKETIQTHHEDLHEEILSNSEIPLILKKHNLDINFLINEKNFKLLEKDIPDLCADRIDYFIRDIFTVKGLAPEKLKKYNNAFAVANNEIIIKNRELAKEIAENYIKMNHDFWGAPFFIGQANIAAEAIRIALKNKIINEKDFLLTDNAVFEKLKTSNNKEILEKLSLIGNKNNFIESTEDNYDMHKTTKFRFIDPKFIENNKILRLSEVDADFKRKLEESKQKYEKGFFIKILKP